MLRPFLAAAVVLTALAAIGCTRAVPATITAGVQWAPNGLRQAEDARAASREATPVVAPSPATPEWPPGYFRPLLGRLNVDRDHRREHLDRALAVVGSEPDPGVRSRLLFLLVPYLVDAADLAGATRALSEAIALIQARPSALPQVLRDLE